MEEKRIDLTVTPFIYILLIIHSISLLSACSEEVVYKQSNGVNQDQIYTYSSRDPNPILLAIATDPLTPCGASSDGRVIFNRKTEVNGHDIYIVNGKDGSGLTSIMSTTKDEACVFVTPDNFVIYSETTPAWQGRHNLMALPIGSVTPKPVATSSYDQRFLAYAPDQSIIYLRQAPVPTLVYNILATKIGNTSPVMLAQVYPTLYSPPKFETVTKDNRVIFSQSTEYLQGKMTLNIFSVKTDGSQQLVIAKKPPANEEFCALTKDNRVIYTERSTSIVNGQLEHYGDIYSVNPDGSNRLLLTKGPPNFDNTCRGVTENNYVIFERKVIKSRDTVLSELYSIFADGQSKPVLLAAASGNYLSNKSNNYFRTTPSNRVLFQETMTTRTPQGTVDKTSLESILADGTSRVTLSNHFYEVLAVTPSDRVVYNVRVPSSSPRVIMNLYIVPADGSAAAKPIAPSIDTQEFGFIYLQKPW